MNEYDPKDKFKMSKPQGKVLIQENVRSYRRELGSALNLEEKVRWIIRIAGVVQASQGRRDSSSHSQSPPCGINEEWWGEIDCRTPREFR